MNDEQLKLSYEQIQSRLEEFHNEEEFDHPAILVLSALLSTILNPYGVQSYDSNIEWYRDDDINFSILFKPLSVFSPEYYDSLRWDREAVERDYRYKIINILNTNNTQIIKSGFKYRGEYILTRYENLQKNDGQYNPNVLTELINIINYINQLGNYI